MHTYIHTYIHTTTLFESLFDLGPILWGDLAQQRKTLAALSMSKAAKPYCVLENKNILLLSKTI
jgi:hypothetical protein